MKKYPKKTEKEGESNGFLCYECVQVWNGQAFRNTEHSKLTLLFEINISKTLNFNTVYTLSKDFYNVLISIMAKTKLCLCRNSLFNFL